MADIFSGCGGLTLGAAEAARSLGLGIEVRLAVDADETAISVYKANFPEAETRCARVEELFDGYLHGALTEAEAAVKEAVGPVDVILGGPPCQGHSNLNNHTRRADPRNGLYGRMARAVEVLEPTIVLIENVPAVTRDVGKVVEQTVARLRACGYAVADAPFAHLKVMVVDVSAAYIGSANITAAGLGGRNLELGVLVRGTQVTVIGSILDLY